MEISQYWENLDTYTFALQYLNKSIIYLRILTVYFNDLLILLNYQSHSEKI